MSPISPTFTICRVSLHEGFEAVDGKPLFLILLDVQDDLGTASERVSSRVGVDLKGVSGRGRDKGMLYRLGVGRRSRREGRDADRRRDEEAGLISAYRV